MSLSISPPQVVVVIVNYQRLRDTLECLQSVMDSNGVHLEVTVVDNGSGDDSAEQIHSNHPEISLVALSENKGFAGGYNTGIEFALAGSAEYIFLLNNDTTLDPGTIRTLVGAASLMSIPWTGGRSVVVWRHTHGYPERLDASYKLVEYLSRKQTMLKLSESSQTLPSRVDALDALFPSEHPMRAVMLQLVSTGRSYRPIPLWHRIEYQFGAELGSVIKMLRQDRSLKLESTLQEAMDSLAHRLDLTLG